MTEIEVGKVCALTDSKPPAFAKIEKVTKFEMWDDELEEDASIIIAFGDWYQWDGENVYRHANAGFETHRLVLATQEEIEIYEEKVNQYQLEESQ